MKESAIRKTNITIIVLTVLIAVALYAGSTGKFRSTGTNVHPEDSAAFFFDGAVIQWIIPNNPGGGYDEYARLIAPYLAKFTGARIHVRNIPGSGGMRALSELFKSPADGLTIGLINGGGMVTNQIAKISGAEFEIEKLSFLGRVATDIRVLALSGQSKYSSFNDIMDAGEEVRIGATGLGGSTYVDAVITREVFGLNMNVIHGFNNSSAMRHAMLRGNIDGTWSSWGSVQDEVDSGRINLVVQGGRTRAASLPNVPTVFEWVEKSADPVLTQNILRALDALHVVGRVVAAPPGMPSERLQFLQQAFRQALHDPEFLDDAVKARRPIVFAPGEEMAEIIVSALVMPAEIRQVFVKAVRSGLQ
jgi:tripartite-type tricarboxylate transporter receptor subunit TctC